MSKARRAAVAAEARAQLDADVASICEKLAITAWDLLLVGDGSGTGSDDPVGWAAVSIERATMECLVWDGAANRGTVNFAEVMAYLQPLNWFAAREAGRKGEARTVRVHVVTDSDYARQMGERHDPLVRRNAGLWAALEAYHRDGFLLHWHYLKRSRCALNRFADRIAGNARKLFRDRDSVR